MIYSVVLGQYSYAIYIVKGRINRFRSDWCLAL